MKTFMGILILLFIAAAVVVVVMHVKEADREKIESETGNVMTDAAKAGKEAATEVATNVAANVKLGMQKAGIVATNVAAKVKEATTNAVGEVKEKIHDATR
jgi:BMFP domain-containing protein YqiC